MSSTNIHDTVAVIARAGITHEESRKGYATWSKNYEKDMGSAGFLASVLTAQYLSESIPKDKRASTRILDVGAGTGLAGKELKEASFEHIDALDSCAQMLEEAKKKKCYENFYVQYLSKEPLDIPADTYDSLTGSGCYGEGGHFPADALYEMIRLVKPGGFIVLVTRAFLLSPSAPPANRDLEPLMDELEGQGKWRKICRDVGKTKIYADFDAIAWKYQVL